ncbi:MAG: TolB family protein, partial [Methylococcales bacterium]
IDGTDIRQLTSFGEGEQIYNPRWSPDGSRIVFDYSIKEGRDIASVAAAGGPMEIIIDGAEDSRNAVFSSDGSKLFYASDRTGIFNIYERDIASGQDRQITNVLGGAFMPSTSSDGTFCFASYTSSGYKIAMLKHDTAAVHDDEETRYRRHVGNGSSIGVSSIVSSHHEGVSKFDWTKLRSYNDSQLPEEQSRSYSSKFSSLSFVPFLRVDNYNPKNKGIDVIKPGLYVFSTDVLEKTGMFAGAAINRNFERDLFFIFDYRDKIPGLFQLGLEPALSLELYNITRKTDASATVGANTINLGVTYSLLEFDAALRGKFLMEALDLEIRFAHSRYTSTLEFPPGFANSAQIIRVDDLYLIGNDVSMTFALDGIARSRTQEVNPVGRKIK